MDNPCFIASEQWQAMILTADEAPCLQAFMAENPLYSQIVNGRPFLPGEALSEITERPPFPHSAALSLAVVETDSQRWLGYVSLAQDLIAPGVCHIGLFLVATALHGTGLAAQVYAALEQRVQQDGACWMRLGVVLGNSRAERFWARMGFMEVRKRHGMPYEGPSTTVRVMCKPLYGQTLDGYLALVERDRPDAP